MNAFTASLCDNIDDNNMNLWVFDNDGTLYDHSNLHLQFNVILITYFSAILNIAEDEVLTLLEKLKIKWGTRLSVVAAIKEYGLSFTETITNTYLKLDLVKATIPNEDAVRREAVSKISGKKIVLTNNPSEFARYVLRHVNLLDCFDEIVGVEELGFITKPDIRAFDLIVRKYPSARRIIFCDDSLENLDAAHARGWITIWFNPSYEGADRVIRHKVIRSFSELIDLY